jgi:hypothetical protein
MHGLMVADFHWPLVGVLEPHVRTVAHEPTRRGHQGTVVSVVVAASESAVAAW